MEGVFALRVMYAAAVLGAGAVGALTLFAPQMATRYVFFSAATVDPFLRILGAVWLSLGLVATMGILKPTDFVSVLLIQIVYKSAWLTIVAYPAIFRGNRDVGLLFFAGLFTVWVIALWFVVPFAEIFAAA